ncbi:MAG: ArsA family ATPase [Chloroflexota bacterium]|nr:ArsA family ATPase [Chloroflexota bacterium]
MARIVVYSGKGGVGKTSIAAATALLCAERGLRTIVISTDIAHSLADSFDRPLGPEPREIAPRLWGQQSDVYYNIRKYWGTIQSYVASVFRWRGLDEVLAEEMTVIPGMDELASLLWIAEHHDTGEYDVIVVDAAPTGETLRLLSLPEAGKWWLDKMLPLERNIARIAGPVLNRTIGMPTPRDEVFTAGEQLFRRLEHMRALLADSSRSSIRVVLNLEKMVIKESQRAFTYFHLYGYLCDLVVANRVLPHDLGGYFQAWRQAQERYKPEVDEMFAPVPVREVPFFEQEVVGLDMLRRVGEQLFHGEDPTAFYYRGRPYEVTREDGEHVISLELPFTTKDQVKMTRHADELVLEVGTFRRNLILPRLLADAPTRGAKLEGDTLRIRFAAARPAAAPKGAGGA